MKTLNEAVPFLPKVIFESPEYIGPMKTAISGAVRPTHGERHRILVFEKDLQVGWLANIGLWAKQNLEFGAGIRVNGISPRVVLLRTYVPRGR